MYWIDALWMDLEDKLISLLKRWGGEEKKVTKFEKWWNGNNFENCKKREIIRKAKTVNIKN